MRVLILFSSSSLGGAERSLTRMALAAQGGRVQYDVATLDGPGPWSAWCIECGLTPQVLGCPSKRHGRLRTHALYRLVRLTRTTTYDAIYVIGVRAALVVRMLKPFFRGATIVHGVRWNPLSNSPLDRFFRSVERLFSWLIDGYIVNSAAAAHTIRSRCGVDETKVHTVYNGIETAPAAPVPVDRNHDVLVIANLNPRKGHIPFLDAAERVQRKHPEARFLFVGRDDMGGRVQRAVAARGLDKVVEFPGLVSNLTPYLNRARVVALPSLWGEGCPTSLLEAQAYGIPTVAYAIDGIPEIIMDEVDGILVAHPDVTAFGDALNRLLDQPSLAAAMGQAGRQKVLTSFALDRCVAAHETVFTGLAEGGA